MLNSAFAAFFSFEREEPEAFRHLGTSDGKTARAIANAKGSVAVYSGENRDKYNLFRDVRRYWFWAIPADFAERLPNCCLTKPKRAQSLSRSARQQSTSAGAAAATGSPTRRQSKTSKRASVQKADTRTSRPATSYVARQRPPPHSPALTLARAPRTKASFMNVFCSFYQGFLWLAFVFFLPCFLFCVKFGHVLLLVGV